MLPVERGDRTCTRASLRQSFYDRVYGGRHAGSGGGGDDAARASLPHFLELVGEDDSTACHLPVYGLGAGNPHPTPPYSAWNLHKVKPIISGLHPHPDYPNTTTVQYTSGHNFAAGYIDDPRVVAEHIGTRVGPDSLYLAQLEDRLTRERGRTEREGGIFNRH